MKSFNYKWKLKSRFAWKIEISSIKTESNRWFHRKPEIILWSLRSFWVERFDLNQSLNIDFGTKSFLYQCKNSARNRFFPRSRLGQMTYRKLKPHPSWYLLHAPFNLFHPCSMKIGKKHWIYRLRNSDGWRDIFWRLFRTRSVMGRLWDDHFRDLGYPPKFYKGQDAGFDSGSLS